MSETSPSSDSRLELDIQYKTTAYNTRARFKLYEYAADGLISMDHKIISDLELEGHETVVDIGCAADQRTLTILRDERVHKGRLVGVDLGPPTVERDDIEFVVADARTTGLESESADAVLALFVLYHVPLEEALEEARRILKPGGVFVAATSNTRNKQKHRKFERLTAESVGVKPPPIFAEDCDDQRLARVLPQYFEDVQQTVTQDTCMHIPENDIPFLMMSLQTMAHSCEPQVPGGAWSRALEQVVGPLIDEEVRRNGYFSDSISRHTFMAKKK